MLYSFKIQTIVVTLLVTPWHLPFCSGFLPHHKSNDPTVFQTKEKSTIGKYKYDIGLGKNSPIIPKMLPFNHTVPFDDDIHSTTTTWQNVYQACRFLPEYESEREFPSPYERRTSPTNCEIPLKSKSIRSISNRGNKNAVIQPKRYLEDVLVVLKDNDQQRHDLVANENNRLPVMLLPNKSNQKLDLNSVWVEMLIHNQQQNTQMMDTVTK